MSSISNKILSEIPMAAAMNFKIKVLGALESTAILPIKENKNHLDTLFGGSLYAASALCSYSCLLKALHEENILDTRIVIVEGDIKYLHPGNGDSEVKAWTQPSALSHFFLELEAKKKSRIYYEAVVSFQGKILSRFKGLYQVNL